MRGYRTLIAAADLSPRTATVIAAAAHVGERLGAERLHLVHIAEPRPSWAIEPINVYGATPGQPWDLIHAAERRALEELEVPGGALKVTRELRSGSPARELVASALEAKADVMVVASHRRGRTNRVVLGSVAFTMLRASPCPVLIVGEDRPARGPVTHILAAIDGSPISARVLGHALGFTAREGGTVRATSVYEPPAFLAHPRRELELDARFTQLMHGLELQHNRAVTGLVDRLKLPGTSLTLDLHDAGEPGRVLLDTARRVRPDLIVCGSSGRNSWENMFVGSTARQIVGDGPCPILVIPHDSTIDL